MIGLKRCTYSLLVLIILNAACTSKDKNGKPLDGPTTGTIKIAVDESLKPLVEAEIDTFEGLYPTAHIEPLYMSEQEAVDALLKDSVRMIFSTRQLYDNEMAVLKVVNIEPRQMNVAKDGIALILNKSNKDSLFSFEQLQGILEGKTNNWHQLDPSLPSASIDIVFDNPKSGMVRFLNDSVVHMDQLPKNCFAVNTNKAVVEYVSQKENAIGLIGVGWISDDDDSTANQFLGTIRVAGISRNSDHYKPYQAYLATNQYPLRRNIYMVSREARTGLASGFMTFVGSDKGQRIILKLGLVPVTMPVRIVEVKHEPLKIQ
ncbi:MAG TPA: substrate-binding domain-containing protein [Cyclobacteriaceae bacterium]